MPSILKQQCIDWGTVLRSEAKAFYAPRIEGAEALFAKAVAAGHDPEKTPVSDGLFFMNYKLHVTEMRAAETAALEAANAEEIRCDTEAVPDWVGDAQKMSDAAVLLMMLPLVALTQNYAADGVDLGEIYKAYPLGGEDALIPKAREELFEALKISGDAAKFLRDPVNEAAAMVTNVIDALPPLPVPAPPKQSPLPKLPKVDLNPLD